MDDCPCSAIRATLVMISLKDQKYFHIRSILILSQNIDIWIYTYFPCSMTQYY